MPLYPFSLYKYIFSATPWGACATSRGSYTPPRGTPATPKCKNGVRGSAGGGTKMKLNHS